MHPFENITYPTRIRVGKDYQLGDPTLLPEEVPYDFDGIQERLRNLTEKTQAEFFQKLREVMCTVLGVDAECAPIPLAIEVGRENESGVFGGGDSRSVLGYDELRPRIHRLVDVGVTGIMVAGQQGYGYVQAPVEELSSAFTEGRRANLIYLRNVLTDDAAGADISSEEQLVHILRELCASLMPKGVLAMANVHNATRAEHLDEIGFNVLFDGHAGISGDMFVAQKRE